MVKLRIFTSLAVLLFMEVLGACSTTVEYHVYQGGGPSIVIPNIPFYPQEINQCGPASLAGVMNFWGYVAKPDDIAREVFSRSVRGTFTLDMVLYAQRRGAEAVQYRGSIEDLKQKIDKGQPLVVLVDYGASLIQANHFMVITGYTPDGIIANSGRTERAFIPQEDFLKSWEKTKYWTLWIKRK